MPFIEIKVFEGEFSEDERKKIIEAVTDVMVSFSGENLRSATWVVIQEVKNGNWGIDGKALGLQESRVLQAGTTRKQMSFVGRSPKPGPSAVHFYILQKGSRAYPLWLCDALFRLLFPRQQLKLSGLLALPLQNLQLSQAGYPL